MRNFIHFNSWPEPCFRFCALPQDSTNLKGDYGNADYDVRHHFTVNAVYNIPGSSHGPQWITHGWQLNTVMSFRTGLPFTVHATTDTSGTGEHRPW
jgi:hypothetical protein